MKRMRLVFALFLALSMASCENKISVNDGDTDVSEDGTPDSAGTESNCLDGIDNDNDTLRDCEDTEDCCSTPSCIELGFCDSDTSVDVITDSTEDPGTDPAVDPIEDSVSDPEPDGPELPPGCVLPDIPDTGLHVYYCMLEDTTATMRFYREVEDSGGSEIVAYSELTSCRVTTPGRDILCEIPGHSGWGSGALAMFIIQTFGVNGGWSCPETNGLPVVKLDGTWMALNPPITSPVCRHNFNMP